MPQSPTGVYDTVSYSRRGSIRRREGSWRNARRHTSAPSSRTARSASPARPSPKHRLFPSTSPTPQRTELARRLPPSWPSQRLPTFRGGGGRCAVKVGPRALRRHEGAQAAHGRRGRSRRRPRAEIEASFCEKRRFCMIYPPCSGLIRRQRAQLGKSNRFSPGETRANRRERAPATGSDHAEPSFLAETRGFSARRGVWPSVHGARARDAAGDRRAADGPRDATRGCGGGTSPPRAGRSGRTPGPARTAPGGRPSGPWPRRAGPPRWARRPSPRPRARVPSP